LLAPQHRPTGAPGPPAAFASLPEELDWLLSFLSPPGEEQALDPACQEDAEALAAGAAVLRAGADRLDGLDTEPDFQRLARARDRAAPAPLGRPAHRPTALPPHAAPAAGH